MTAAEFTWREVPASEVREGQRVRLTIKPDGECPGGIVEGDAYRYSGGELNVVAWRVEGRYASRIEVATPPLPTEPGTVIDATTADGRFRVTVDESPRTWPAVSHAEWVFYGVDPRDITAWSLVAPAPSKPDSGTMIIDRPAATDPVAPDPYMVGLAYLIGSKPRLWRYVGGGAWERIGQESIRATSSGFAEAKIRGPIDLDSIPLVAPAPGGENA